MKKIIVLTVLMLFVGSALIAQEEDSSGLSEKDKAELVKMVFTPKPFMESADVRMYPETMVLFKNSIYEKMKGNVFLGYQHDEGVSVDTKVVQLVQLESLQGFEEYKAPFFEVMKRAWGKEGMSLVEKSHIKMGIAIVSVVPEKTEESFPGLVLEYYILNEKQNKAFYGRKYSGKLKGLLYAMLEINEGIIHQYKMLEIRDVVVTKE
jgi:hypothetical protein